MGQLNRRELMAHAAAMAAAGIPAVHAAPLRPLAGRGDVDAVLKTKVEAGEVPGVVAMATTARATVYEGAFGLRALGAPASMSVDTVFRIASMVKLLTSVAALQLVEQGRLKLDEPAGNIDPSLADPQVLTGFDAKGVPQLRPARRPITLRNLLTHTSGFSYPLWNPNVGRYHRAARANAGLPRSALMFEPDSKWAYGGSIDRVGRLVEIASGMMIDRYFHDNITHPLGLNDTAFTITEAQRAREAHLHVRDKGRLVPQPQEKPSPTRIFSGGGGIYSTAPDYLTLLQALLNGGSLGGKTILRPQTVELMAANQIGDLEAGVMKTTNPAVSADVDFFPHTRLRWGFGGMINLDARADGRKAGSMTWAGLYNTYYWIDPSAGLAGVMMMQVLPFADPRALGVYRAFARAIYHAAKAA
jgi:CubicO group peptidase (beta-lactamase class C family)